MLGALERPDYVPSVAERAQAPARWLLLRGLGRERRHWFDFPQALATGLGVEHCAVDLPGVGQRCRESAPGSIEEVALGVRRQLAVLERPGPWGVLGISLGGMVALSLAAAWPAGVSHVVAINSSARCSLAHQRLRPAALARLLAAALAPNASERERRIYALTTNASGRRVAGWAARAAELGREVPLARQALLRQLFAAAAFRPPRVAQAALILSSDNDRVVSAVCSSALARELGAPHRSHPTAGHDLPLEDPAWVIEQMRAWLAPETSTRD